MKKIHIIFLPLIFLVLACEKYEGGYEICEEYVGSKPVITDARWKDNNSTDFIFKVNASNLKEVGIRVVDNEGKTNDIEASPIEDPSLRNSEDNGYYHADLKSFEPYKGKTITVKAFAYNGVGDRVYADINTIDTNITFKDISIGGNSSTKATISWKCTSDLKITECWLMDVENKTVKEVKLDNQNYSCEVKKESKELTYKIYAKNLSGTYNYSEDITIDPSGIPGADDNPTPGKP